MWFLLRSDNYLRRTGGGGGGGGGGVDGLLVSRLSDRVLHTRDGVSRKNRFQNQINFNANIKLLIQKST